MNVLQLAPMRRARGTVRLPGSKSISNRALLLAALAQGETLVRGVLDADDTRVMRAALDALGVACLSERGGVRVCGADGNLPVRSADLYLGNAGTAFRPLTAVLALAGGSYRLTGTARMHERPIGDLVSALRGIGAVIAYEAREGFPPLVVRPGKIRLNRPVRVRGEVSSQFVTALLLALPLLRRPVRIEVEGTLISTPYVEITLNLMQRFGVAVAREDWQVFALSGETYRSPGEFLVEGDASSASYFLAAGALAGGPVRVQGVGRDSIQGDVRFTEVLRAMGAKVDAGEDWLEARGNGRPLRAFDRDMNDIPDAAMTAAVLALFADGPCTLRNIASWRVKETDRIAAMAKELAKLGASVEAGPDFLHIRPPSEPREGVEVDTYDDHRMAMAFSLVSAGGVPVSIRDPECVAKTYPDYFDALTGIGSGDE